MKNCFLIFFILYNIPCLSQDKTLDVYFSDSVNEKEITLHYSIQGILNYFYEPYMSVPKTRGNHLSFEIPDSISTFLMVLPPSASYRWGKNIILLMKPEEKLAIYLDTLHTPKFEGDNVNLHQFMYLLKNGSGVERIEQTLREFMENPNASSFYNFINQKIENNIAVLDSLLDNNHIDASSYVFAKNQTFDDYLFRSANIGLRTDKDYFSKIDSTLFYTDLNKLFEQYDVVCDWKISSIDKAKLRTMGLISGSKLDLGLDSIYSLSSYLSKDEQERVDASEIIGNLAAGQLDSLQLDKQRKKYEEAFPNSIYNPILNQLKPLNQKDYIFASYSKEDGFHEYGRLKTDNLSKIISMFMGGHYVFIDFWATWCGPCIKEFGYMNDFETFAKEHNIGILYVSLDYPNAYDRWKQRIEDLQLEGLHYFGGQEFANQLSYFQEDRYIPRYVFLDKNGATLIDKCELPSSGKLIQQIISKIMISKL